MELRYDPEPDRLEFIIGEGNESDELIIEQSGGLMDGLNGPPPSFSAGKIFFRPIKPIWHFYVWGDDGQYHTILKFSGIPYPSRLRRFLVKLIFGWNTHYIVRGDE